VLTVKAAILQTFVHDTPMMFGRHFCRVSINAISVVSRWGQRPVGPAQVQVQRRREGRGGRGRRFGGGKRVGPEVIEGGLEGAVGRVATPPVAGRSDA
jgi:hypothetical protein